MIDTLLEKIIAPISTALIVRWIGNWKRDSISAETSTEIETTYNRLAKNHRRMWLSILGLAGLVGFGTWQLISFIKPSTPLTRIDVALIAFWICLIYTQGGLLTDWIVAQFKDRKALRQLEINMHRTLAKEEASRKLAQEASD